MRLLRFQKTGGENKLEENWYALVIAILLKQPQETAFQILEIGKRNRKSLLGTDDTRDMIRLREQGCSLWEIGDMYGISDSAVSKRIGYYKNKKNRPTAIGTAS